MHDRDARLQLALAGTNAGFSVTLDPSEVRAPAIGDQIDIAIFETII